MEMLELQNLHKTFNPGTVNEKVALNGVSLTMEAGDFATIVGSNGAGKSTLFNAITGGFIADEGSISLGGENITFAPEYQRSKVIGHLFQDPLKGTAPNMTIEENLALAYLRAGTAPHAIFSRISRKDKEIFREKLALLNMGLEDRMKQPVGLLSGGQRQALTLLMATLVTPKLLLLDEHTAALDPATAEKVLELTKSIVAEKKITCLMVTHNMHQALELGNRTLMMDASKEALEYWSPVDWYNGGMEHTTLHLLYSRFWHKFLYDIGVVPSPEPYQKRTAHGMILGLNPHSFVNLPADEQKKLLEEYGSQKAAEKALEEKYGEMARHPIVKMSKSLGNVINPDEVVDQYGADTMRLYEMFMGDFEQAAPWQTSAIAGCNRFLDRVWGLSDKLVEGEGYRPAIETLMHQTIKKVSADIEGLKMNTAIAQLMTLVNALYENGGATKAEFETVLQLLNPFAPHMTEELWEKLGHSHDEQLAYYPWPEYEEAKCVEATVEIAVQVNGKVKARLKVAADITAEDAIATAKADPAVADALAGKTVVKEIYVKGRLVNLAVKG